MRRSMAFLSRGSSNQNLLLRCNAQMMPEHKSTTSMERVGEPKSAKGHNRTNMLGDKNARAMTQIGANLAVPPILEKRPGSPSSSGPEIEIGRASCRERA